MQQRYDKILFSENLNQHLIKILQLSCVTGSGREKEPSLINALCLNSKLKDIWNIILVSNGLEGFLAEKHLLYYFIITRVYKKHLICRNNQLKNRHSIAEDLALTSQEEKTFRYVSGFIVFSLTKTKIINQQKLFYNY